MKYAEIATWFVLFNKCTLVMRKISPSFVDRNEERRGEGREGEEDCKEFISSALFSIYEFIYEFMVVALTINKK